MSTTTIPNSTTLSTEALVHELLVQNRAIERAEDRADAIKAQLIERIGEGGKAETDLAKVAIVVTHTPVLDFDALKVTASTGFFYKATKRVVDMSAVKALMSLGQVPTGVAEIISERVSAPSVRITMKPRK